MSEPARPSVQDTPPEFPGCDAIPMTLRELERTHERLEFRDARGEIAWKVRDYVTVHHEQSISRLAMLAGRIASVRGSPSPASGGAAGPLPRRLTRSGSVSCESGGAAHGRGAS